MSDPQTQLQTLWCFADCFRSGKHYRTMSILRAVQNRRSSSLAEPNPATTRQRARLDSPAPPAGSPQQGRKTYVAVSWLRIVTSAGIDSRLLASEGVLTFANIGPSSHGKSDASARRKRYSQGSGTEPA